MRDQIVVALYVVALSLSSIHLYRNPIYDMDAFQYAGNALLIEEHDIVRLHRRVYNEFRREIPEQALRGLLGQDPNAPKDQNDSRQERASNPYRYSEFLPFFAIRPLYNQTLWGVNKLGIGLIGAAAFISVLSYFCIGIVLFRWITKYTTFAFGAAFSFLLMISPPLTGLGRDLTSDAAATFVCFAGLFFVFAKRRLLLGILLILLSLYFRTDFIVLAGPLFLVCWLEGRLEFWETTVLSLVAVGSVLTINHFSGDYGIRMLYYRNFVGVPVAPAEMIVEFTFRDYLAAFRSGLTLVANSFFIPFLILGVIGLAGRGLRRLLYVSLAYVGLHFIILPNWQERWVGVFYLCCGVGAVSALGEFAGLENHDSLDVQHD